jgi:hemolysin D
MSTDVSTNGAAPLPRHPVIELFARYQAVFKAAWEHRHELAGPKRLADETAFLPAALSLQETPVHPAPRRLAWIIMVLFVLALAWSIFGQVDIVAVAPGRIIVSDRTKVIQPLEDSVVKRVLVRDGDRVKAGQLLIELDPTMASADKASVQEQLKAAVSEEQRTGALLSGLTTGQAPRLGKSSDAATRTQLESEWQDIQAKLAKLDAEIARRQAEMATVKEVIAKLEETVPMARAR